VRIPINDALADLSRIRMYDVIIIGSGAAGYTAAVYSCRAGRKTLLIAGSVPGGQLMLTSDVENFPGFPEAVIGPELMERMRKQAERFGPDIIYDDAAEVHFKTRPFKVTVGKSTHEGKTVILSTGANAKWLNIPSETRLRGHGVSSCATCDGYFFKEKDVVVVGGGDTAMEEATFLANITRKVTVVHRRDKLRASQILQERSLKNPKIGFVWDSVVDEILGDKSVTGVRSRNLKTGKEQTLKADGVFVAIGHEPNTSLFKGQIDLDSKGYIVTKRETETNVPGVFAAGDVRDFRYRQAITAAADGCKAAMDADRFIGEHYKS
jgi:thioredoxin reductase (NADPH)